MNSQVPEGQLFEQVAEKAEHLDASLPVAPARLKARIYSILVKRQQESGPLHSLTETKAAGGRLCVFEHACRITAVGEKMKRLNLCRVCHARLLAEKMEKAPIYWSGCPYVDFQRLESGKDAPRSLMDGDGGVYKALKERPTPDEDN